MNHAEAWLLEAVVETRVPLCFLVAPNIEILFNRDGHGLEPDGLKKLLWAMFRRGDLLGYSWERDAFQPTLEELKAALVVTPVGRSREDDDRRVHYHLTQQGGARWEHYARPDWAKYVTSCQSWPDDDDNIIEVKIAASAKESLSRFFDGLGELDRVIVPGSISMLRLAPWEEIYWKSLPEGYELTFRCRDDDWDRRWDRRPDAPINDPGWLLTRGPFGIDSLCAGP